VIADASLSANHPIGYLGPWGKLHTARGQCPDAKGLERSLFQLGIGRQPFESGVLTLEILETSGILGLEPAELVAPPVIRRFRDSQSRRTAAVSLPSASSRSTAISMRTTCSGLCRFLVAMIF